MQGTVSGIYCIKNIITNKKYIGQSVNINDRWRRHISELEHNSHHNDYLQKSWNKYGINCFKFYVLEYCDVENLDEREIYYIDLYNTLDREFGYNLKSGGQNSSCTYTEEVRKRMSESAKQSYDQYLIDKRKQDALNQWSNPNIKEKIIGKNNGMYGKHHTDEAKQKMSENRKGISPVNKNTSPVFCIELNKEYKDATEAGKELSIRSGNILKVCRGVRKTCGGYNWKFINNIGK